jgi:hypothetical protein
MLGFSSQELVIVQTARPNVLLISGDAEVEAGLCLLARIVRQPMVCSRAPALTLPDPSQSSSTRLLVRRRCDFAA